MILFFYGEDTYRLRQKLNQLKAKFISASLGDTNLAVLEGKTVAYNQFSREILAIPFLSKKRLVIVEGLLCEGSQKIQEQISPFLKKIPESTIVAFVESGLPDRRTALFRRLNLAGQAQEFKLLQGEALSRWLKKEVASLGGQIDNCAASKLIEFVGNDLWCLSHEIRKLVAYSQKITVLSVELLVQPLIQANIFNLIDLLARRQTSRAIIEFYKLLKTGASEIYILTMIQYQYRNLLIVKDFQKLKPQFSRSDLAKKAGLHPFVLAKTLSLTGEYDLINLKKIYRRLLDFESLIKVGKIESRLALELLIFHLAR